MNKDEMPTREQIERVLKRNLSTPPSGDIAGELLALFAPKRDLHFALRPMELTQDEAAELDRFRKS